MTRENDQINQSENMCLLCSYCVEITLILSCYYLDMILGKINPKMETLKK